MPYMTDFFTHFYKKSKALSLASRLLGLSLILACVAWAGSPLLNIKSAELQPLDQFYLLNANFELNLSAAVEEAVNKGVPLTFLIEFQVVAPRKYWFDDEIATSSAQVTLSYHALSRQYLVTRESHQRAFTSLADAKDEISRLRDWVVFEKALLKKGETYDAALRIRLDQSKLPKPLQVEALGSEHWNMVSPRYRWTPVFAL